MSIESLYTIDSSAQLIVNGIGVGFLLVSFSALIGYAIQMILKLLNFAI